MEEESLKISPARVKEEPPVEFVLILPRPTFGWPAIKQEKDIKPKRIPTVKLEKFDAKWRSESKLFQTFHTCPRCHLVIRLQGNLSQHLRTCSEINPERFECDHCDERFQKKWLMRQRMQKHSSERKFCCSKCGFGFKTKSDLNQHSRAKKIYECAVCEVKFSCYPLLNRHRSDFHGNVFKCDKCSYQSRIRMHFTRHKRIHNKTFACETCQNKFSTNEHLKLHQMQHQHGTYAAAPEVVFDCLKCGKFFSSPRYLKMHQRNMHGGKEEKCKVCEKIFRNRHLLLHHSQIHKKVECSICHKMFNKYLMASHLRSHSAANNFSCDLCNHSTKTKRSLKEHIERMHLLKKLVNDSKCRADFSDFELLEKLQLKHGSSATTSEKKFKCDKCVKSFVTSNRLNQHKRKVHSEKLCECEICKKAFKAKYNLNRHRAKAHSKK